MICTAYQFLTEFATQHCEHGPGLTAGLREAERCWPSFWLPGLLAGKVVFYPLCTSECVSHSRVVKGVLEDLTSLLHAALLSSAFLPPPLLEQRRSPANTGSPAPLPPLQAQLSEVWPLGLVRHSQPHPSLPSSLLSLIINYSGCKVQLQLHFLKPPFPRPLLPQEGALSALGASTH